MGLLAGVLAAFCASVAGYVMAKQVFELEYQLNLLVWLIGIVGGMAGIGVAGIALGFATDCSTVSLSCGLKKQDCFDCPQLYTVFIVTISLKH